MFGSRKLRDMEVREAPGLGEGGAVLVDVREDDEWEADHAPDAVHVPLAEVGKAAGRFAGRRVMVVCRSGNRSAKAAKALAEASVDVTNVAGGMSSWAAAGLPVVRPDGSSGVVA